MILQMNLLQIKSQPQIQHLVTVATHSLPASAVVFKIMGRQDDLRKTYLTVQDSGKKQLNKHKQNESNRQPPQVRIKCVFVFVLCFCSIVHCSKSETYLLISITQWPIRGV